MSVEFLQDLIKIDFPDSDILERKASSWQFLNFPIGEIEVAIEYNEYLGYGVSLFDKDNHPLDGLFGKCDAFFVEEQDVIEYLKQEITRRNETSSTNIRGGNDTQKSD